jgi:hypothetical protein
VIEQLGGGEKALYFHTRLARESFNYFSCELDFVGYQTASLLPDRPWIGLC